MLDPTLEREGLGPSPFSAALEEDWRSRAPAIASELGGASVLVVGAAGTIGVAAVREVLGLAPARVELVDVDENGLARLARDIRSRGAGARVGFNALDFAGAPGLAFVDAAGPFDLVLNFAAVKHVRSEKNLFTLLHMIDVNVVRQKRFAEHLASAGLARRHFVVSTDKAADPSSFMGASKRMLEALILAGADAPGAPAASLARFANVAWSNGSLLESYLQRFAAGQALAAPRDTRRYFISARDAARICLLTQHACGPGLVVVPRFETSAAAVELADTAAAFLRRQGRTAVFVDTPPAAAALEGRHGPAYPVLLTPRDTAGEKEVEVFRGEGERAEPLGLGSLEAVRPPAPDRSALEAALSELQALVGRPDGATTERIEAALRVAAPGFRHDAGQALLDDRI